MRCPTCASIMCSGSGPFTSGGTASQAAPNQAHSSTGASGGRSSSGFMTFSHTFMHLGMTSLCIPCFLQLIACILSAAGCHVCYITCVYRCQEAWPSKREQEQANNANILAAGKGEPTASQSKRAIKLTAKGGAWLNSVQQGKV